MCMGKERKKGARKVYPRSASSPSLVPSSLTRGQRWTIADSIVLRATEGFLTLREAEGLEGPALARSTLTALRFLQAQLEDFSTYAINLAYFPAHESSPALLLKLQERSHDTLVSIRAVTDVAWAAHYLERSRRGH